MTRYVALIAALLATACNKPDREERAISDAQAVAAVEAAQNREPPLVAVNLEPSVLASRKDLEALIFETGALKLTQGWRAQLVGDELRTRIAEVPLSTRLVPVG